MTTIEKPESHRWHRKLILKCESSKVQQKSIPTICMCENTFSLSKDFSFYRGFSKMHGTLIMATKVLLLELDLYHLR